MFDNAIGPILSQPEVAAVIAFGAEQAADFRVCALGLLVEILRGDAELLGIEHSKGGPAHEIEPLIVTLPNRRAERLLRYAFRQDDMIVRSAELQALRHKL